MDKWENTISRLYTAVHIGNLREVKQLSSFLYQTKQWLPDYQLLCISLQHKYINIAKLFLNSECEVTGNSERNYKGNSALHLAVLYGDAQLVKLLLERGAPTNIRNKDGLLPLHLVVYRNPIISRTSLSNKIFDQESSTIVNILLKYGIDINEEVYSYTKYGYTALHLAAECGNQRIIPILLQKNANFNAKCQKGLTPLHVAVLNRNSNIVCYLLEQGVFIFPKDYRAKTPLCCAIEHNQIDIITIILNFDPCQSRVRYSNPLTLADDYCSILTAVKKGDSQLVEYLLDKGASVNVSWKNGTTPLHIAIENTNEDILLVLLNHGADVTAAARDGRTPLHLAVERDWLHVIPILLNYVPDISFALSLQTNDGLTPVDLAIQKGSQEMVELFFQKGKPSSSVKSADSPLHIAVQHNQRNIVRILLQNQVGLESVNSQGKTAFQLAAEQGCLKIIQEFCDFYCQKDNKWKEGYSALYIAALNGREDVVQLLIENGADLNARLENYRTPLFAAAEKGHLNIVQLFLKNGVDVNETREDGKTALHFAIENNSFQIAKCLLDNGANVNTKVLGTTPLHAASYAGNSKMVKLLVNNGADVNATNLSDETPLFISVERNWNKIVKYLVKNGADTSIQGQDSTIKSFNYRSDCIYNLKSIRGLRPLLVAVDNNNLEIVEILLQTGCPADVDNERISPLHLASAQGNLPIVKLLIKFGADINWICEQKYTPLSHAIDSGKTDTFFYLISTGTNFCDNEKNSSLHIALNSTIKDKQIVEILLDFGVDPNAINFEDKTPLQCAISVANRLEEQTIFPILLDYGARLNTCDKMGNTPLHLAAINGDFASAEVFLDYGANINEINNEGFTPLGCLEDSIADELIIYLNSQRDKCPFAKMAKILVGLIALRESLGEAVVKENVHLVKTKKFNSFYEKCKRDLINMKMQRISDYFSYYDVLTKKEVLFFCVRNQKIVHNLQSDNLKQRFPCYAFMFSNSIRKLYERINLVKSSEPIFEKIFEFKFPFLVRSEICQYLSSSDFKNMARALYINRNAIMKNLSKNC